MRLRSLLSAAIAIFAAVSALADGKAIANPCLLLNESEASAAQGVPAKFGIKLDLLGTCVFKSLLKYSIYALSVGG